MSKSDFWERQEPHSRVKTKIVVDYFRAWANVMKDRCKELTYLDLCSGRGYYESNEPSTPIEILNAVQEMEGLKDKLRVHFYERPGQNCDLLTGYVRDHQASSVLKYRPEVHPELVERELICRLPLTDGTLTFLDPHGYDELSLELLEAVVEGWGNDCIFFLSVTGIHRNIVQERNAASLKRIFLDSGYETLATLARRREGTFHRALMVQMRLVLQRKRKLFIRPFAFEAEDKKGITHFLVFVSKNVRGFSIVKDIMSNPQFCLYDSDGEPIYRYRALPVSFSLYFPPTYSRLKSKLHRDFLGQTLTMQEIVDLCHSREYSAPRKVIIEALTQLVTTEEVELVKKVRGRDKNALGSKSVIKFRT